MEENIRRPMPKDPEELAKAVLRGGAPKKED